MTRQHITVEGGHRMYLDEGRMEARRDVYSQIVRMARATPRYELRESVPFTALLERYNALGGRARWLGDDLWLACLSEYAWEDDDA